MKLLSQYWNNIERVCVLYGHHIHCEYGCNLDVYPRKLSVWFGLVSLLRTAVILFNPLLEKKEVHTFQKGISPKVNVIARLGFEPVYFEVAVQHFSYFVPRSIRIEDDSMSEIQIRFSYQCFKLGWESIESDSHSGVASITKHLKMLNKLWLQSKVIFDWLSMDWKSWKFYRLLEKNIRPFWISQLPIHHFFYKKILNPPPRAVTILSTIQIWLRLTSDLSQS